MKAAETKKREGLFELKEETLRNKNELERESKERRSELQKFEKRVLAKEEALDRKADSLEKRESQLTSREDKLNKRQAEVDALSEKRVQELERISGLTSEQAKDYLLKTVERKPKSTWLPQSRNVQLTMLLRQRFPLFRFRMTR